MFSIDGKYITVRLTMDEYDELISFTLPPWFVDRIVMLAKRKNKSNQYVDLKWGRDTKKKLKRQSTPAEKLFKAILKSMGIRSRPQEPFNCGGKQYFADFYLPDHNIVFEIDGGHHEQLKDEDAKRTNRLINYGIGCVYRISNYDVLNKKQYVKGFVKNAIK